MHVLLECLTYVVLSQVMTGQPEGCKVLVQGMVQKIGGKSSRRWNQHIEVHTKTVTNKLRSTSTNSTPPVADSPGLRGSSPVLGPPLNGSSLNGNGRSSRLKANSEQLPLRDPAEGITSSLTVGSPERY